MSCLNLFRAIIILSFIINLFFTMNCKVLIYSFHSIIQIGLTFCVKKSISNATIYKASSLEQVFTLLANSDFDLLIFDVQHYTEILYINEQLGISLNGKRIVFLIDNMELEKLLDFNNVVYIHRDSCETEIVKCLRKFLKVRKPVSNFKYKNVTNRFQKENKLSAREKQCANLLLKGYSVSQISKELSLRMSTICTYKKRIQVKTKTKNVVQLLNLFYKLEQ